MRVQTMRRVDRWLGAPLCAVLSIARRVGGWFRRGASAPVASIVFVKLAEQGSTVLAFTALRRAVELVGRENVHFVVFEENRFILDILDVIPAGNVVAIRTGSVLATLVSCVAAVRRLRRLRLDAAIDLEFFARSSAAIAYLSGARCRVGYHAFGGEGPYRGTLMTHPLLYNAYQHTAQAFDGMVAALAEDPELLPARREPPLPAAADLPTFEPTAAEFEAVRAILAGASGHETSAPLVLLNANCSDLLPLRRWPAERYVELARSLLAADESLHIGFTGTGSEAEPVRALVRQVDSPRCFSLAGSTTMRQLLVLYHLAEVMVTNDSGPAHFAALTPMDVVALFGPETPHLFGSLSPRSHVLWAALACSPCVSALNNRTTPCRDNLCMQALGVEQVRGRVLEILSRRGVTRPG